MEQNTTVVETIIHHHIIYIFIGHHKARLTNIEIGKAVVALNPQRFQHMNFRKEKDCYKIYMHINQNILAEYQR